MSGFDDIASERLILRLLPREALAATAAGEIFEASRAIALDLPADCKFVTRCTERIEKCELIEPELIETQPGHWVRCHLVNP